MKRIVLLIVFAFVFCSIQTAYSQAKWTEWKEYTTLTKDQQNFVRIEYKTSYSPYYYPNAKWRIVNLSSYVLYDLSIGDRYITLSSGEREFRGAEGARQLDLGETETFSEDTYCCEGTSITKLEIEYIKFKFTKYGESTRVTIY